jgi:hypothetical protein
MPTFNTTDPKPGYVYDSAVDTWYPLLGIAPASQVDRWTKTAAGGETSLSGNDDNAVSLSYTSGTEQVYLNGVLLVRGQDYTATNGTTITGLSALTASDVAEVVTFNPSNILTTDAVLSTDFDAKGDLISASAASTPIRVPVGTDGYVLKANSATTSGLEWSAADDADAIQNSIIAAKGDIISASANDTPAILTVGNNGETLVADSSTSTGLRWQGNYAAGKNAIINGDFGVWQRGTSFSPTNGSFTADRWSNVFDGSGATRTISQQTFTPGNTIPGYEFDYFFRFAQSVAGTGGTYNLFQNRMEDVRTFAGQTVTISFWGKAATSTNLVKLNFEQEFGTGGSPSAGVSTDLSTGTITLTTSWQRFSYTVTVPSISGKTVGTTTPGFLGLRVWCPVNSTFTLDFVGFQVELGSTATSFQTATGTIQGELAACQRYYYRQTAGTLYAVFGTGYISTTTAANFVFPFPVTMRTVASSAEAANVEVIDYSNGTLAASSPSLAVTEISPQMGRIGWTISGGTAGRGAFIRASNNVAAYVGFSAEL